MIRACAYPRRVPKLLQRCYGAGDLHFITCSCYQRQPRLGTASRRDLFLTVLERVRRRYRFVVMGYVVMPEHFHLLITEPQVGDPSVVMQALKLGFARRVLAEMARTQVSKSARPGAPSGFSSVNIQRQTLAMLAPGMLATRRMGPRRTADKEMCIIRRYEARM